MGLIAVGTRYPGSGVIVRHTEANPAPGVQAFFPVPAGVLWRPLSFTATLNTDATVVNRAIGLLLFGEGVQILSQVPSAFTVAATQSATITALAGTDGAGVQTLSPHRMMWGAFPDQTYLSAGWLVILEAEGLVAGDQWIDLRLLTEQWSV